MPKDIIKKLKGIIKPVKTYECLTDAIQLCEKKPNAHLKHVIISGIGDEAIAIILDEIGFATNIFIDGHKAKKACDAVIFCQIDNEGYILILDMKSSIPDDNDHVYQLISGDCFIDYLLSVLERFDHIKLNANWQRRYFIFHCGNNKRTTNPPNAQEPPHNTQAEKAHICLVNNGETVPLRKLLNKPL
ncbi:MAG: hypothetical protein WAX77_03170 [Methylococcaceae bacterium]